jgi:ATP synthase protein I
VKPLPSAAVFLGLGTAVAGCLAVGVFAGIWVDGLTHTSPLFLVVGLVLGVAAAVGTVVTQVRRFL